MYNTYRKDLLKKSSLMSLQGASQMRRHLAHIPSSGGAFKSKGIFSKLLNIGSKKGSKLAAKSPKIKALGVNLHPGSATSSTVKSKEAYKKMLREFRNKMIDSDMNLDTINNLVSNQRNMLNEAQAAAASAKPGLFSRLIGNPLKSTGKFAVQHPGATTLGLMGGGAAYGIGSAQGYHSGYHTGGRESTQKWKGTADLYKTMYRNTKDNRFRRIRG